MKRIFRNLTHEIFLKIYDTNGQKYSLFYRVSRMLQLHHDPLCKKLYVPQNNSVEGAGFITPHHIWYRPCSL